MEKRSKELLLNITVTAFILSVVYSAFVANIDNSLVSLTPYASGPGDSVVFVLSFLILYPLHILLSILNFAAASLARGSLPKQLVLFNGAGLLITAAGYWFIHELEVLWLIFSLAVISIITVMRK